MVLVVVHYNTFVVNLSRVIEAIAIFFFLNPVMKNWNRHGMFQKQKAACFFFDAVYFTHCALNMQSVRPSGPTQPFIYYLLKSRL